jgi:hypothetical protein
MSRPPPVAGGIAKPNGITLSLDQRQLWVSEYGGTNVWNPDRRGWYVARRERYAELRKPGTNRTPAVMALDRHRRARLCDLSRRHPDH